MHLPLDNLKKICYNINIRKNKGCGYLMSHYVICSVCGARFDRDKEQAVKTGARRYAHYKCSPNSELVPLPQKEEDPDLTKLKDYIKANNLVGISVLCGSVWPPVKQVMCEYFDKVIIV